MKLIRLSDGCYVNPIDVQEITVNGSGHGDVITVRMRNGIGHNFFPDDRKAGARETVKRINREIEAATDTAAEPFAWIGEHSDGEPVVIFRREVADAWNGAPLTPVYAALTKSNPQDGV